ncbi:NtaA/DmoA family FMN-dependent monooxygenase [Rhodococcus sp. BP-252]|uniref:NtaA/DmoA family FMN-dependent monooxygenase n=1 Tax=unclassified Rhodococcus (in: high G+C Gram-positive bacteria) TaxID=192944 RepID=UPI00143119D3|nr:MULTISPECIES: NtaA/DmoA family FMN-dependent monooxygenase [unclassified Rhodococcus (in: high G+C Gram-positive bacteria)]MBY6412518.1 NtaA/DmoA family FMN-dependent monooxygenase [Rhodococcus sp. BP-320]MBY6417227.1 NtaA/DmoA family FMN-dependent monooxygenase [Rhodococcus sp. BP-321]MBY6424152.1 NtaA/DmoA family FMN-dependent monooxygenase [Rhodococcus sp. BP-324]MBY6427251.1 NtaA/DmoA family FMN-dependent monooxygenase [Rhodococcus sp. BP-323]MBY6432136.1 NtaA/DmoA family FMN-dependent 
MTSAGRRRTLKTVTGVSGGQDIYDLAVDPTQSTLATSVEVAKIAEHNRIDALFAADLLSFGAQGAIGAQEPLIYLAALAAVTKHVGLIATVTTTFHHPYNLARLFGTLDHVSNGRAAWNAVTSSLGEENYGDQNLPSPEERYARATESLEVVHALYDSWKPGALTPGPDGAVLDASLVQPIDYRGKYYTVQGPLNIPSLPQGRPVQFQAGQSAGGIELGARFAEVVFTSLATLEDAVTYTKTIRTRAAELGRGGELPLIFSSFHATYGASEAEVRQLLKEREESTDFDAGRARLADMLGGEIDLTELPLDKPIPVDLLPDPKTVNRRRGRVEIFGKLAAEGKTLRELIIASKDTGHWAEAGTPDQLADAIAQRYDAGVLDVISIGGLADPRTRDFALNGLLPELRRRGIVGRDYLGATFRENLELPQFESR